MSIEGGIKSKDNASHEREPLLPFYIDIRQNYDEGQINLREGHI